MRAGGRDAMRVFELRGWREDDSQSLDHRRALTPTPHAAADNVRQPDGARLSGVAVVDEQKTARPERSERAIPAPLVGRRRGVRQAEQRDQGTAGAVSG